MMMRRGKQRWVLALLVVIALGTLGWTNVARRAEMAVAGVPLYTVKVDGGELRIFGQVSWYREWRFYRPSLFGPRLVTSGSGPAWDGSNDGVSAAVSLADLESAGNKPTWVGELADPSVDTIVLGMGRDSHLPRYILRTVEFPAKVGFFALPIPAELAQGDWAWIGLRRGGSEVEWLRPYVLSSRGK